MRTGKGWCPFAEQIEGVTTYDNRQLQPVGFCDHAAGGFYTTLQNPGFWNNAGVSTHFAISRDGRICQMVNVFEIAFAQGRLGPVVIWPHWRERGSPNPNLLFISTEHEDWELVNGKARAIPGSQWTQAEFDADLKLKKWCIEEYRKEGVNLLEYGIESLTGHYMFDGVNRAECPGKYWRDEYRAKLFGLLRSPEVAMDPKSGWFQEGNFQCFYNNGFCGERRGSTDGQFPFRISKAFGDPAKDGNWWWLRKGGSRVAVGVPEVADAYWSLEEGD